MMRAGPYNLWRMTSPPYSTPVFLWWQMLRHHPVLECVAQARAANFEQQHVEAQGRIWGETTWVLTLISLHNDWFG